LVRPRTDGVAVNNLKRFTLCKVMNHNYTQVA